MTAVEWYTIELKLLMAKRENGMNVLDFRNEFDNLSEQANKMFEQQIIDAYKDGFNEAEQYYKEIYKNNKP